jgi:hypothetical protein
MVGFRIDWFIFDFDGFNFGVEVEVLNVFGKGDLWVLGEFETDFIKELHLLPVFAEVDVGTRGDELTVVDFLAGHDDVVFEDE